MDNMAEIGLQQAPTKVPARTWLVVAVAAAVAYGLTLENGAVLQAGATTLHELFHDGRHLLGVPCH